MITNDGKTISLKRVFLFMLEQNSSLGNKWHKTAVISATSSFILHQNVDYSNQNWQN
jgi:hypothetical protein